MAVDEQRFEYVGFWARAWASLIDTVLSCFIVAPLVTAIYGREYWSDTALIKGPLDFVVSFVLPAIGIVAFWIARQATPGKMAIHARIVDARSGERPTTGQLIGRYLGYYVSLFAFGLGFLWVAWDDRKQGWHDKLAGTVVVRERRA